VTVSEVGGGIITSLPAAGVTTTFTNVEYGKAPDGPSGQAQGQIRASCAYPTGPDKEGTPVDVVYNAGNTQEIRATAKLTDVITWPTWATYFPAGNWLNIPPSTAVSGNFPGAGTAVTGPFPVVYLYTYTVSNTLLCVTGVQVGALRRLS
jgi:hypothetical protein